MTALIGRGDGGGKFGLNQLSCALCSHREFQTEILLKCGDLATRCLPKVVTSDGNSPPPDRDTNPTSGE